jgi:lipopolysaccharide biosynthesis glycosyltransferase
MQAPTSEAVMRLFRPCAMLRLDMLHLLPAHVDRVLYLDTDTLLLTDVSKLWAEFGRFEKGRHAIGVVPDDVCCNRCVG